MSTSLLYHVFDIRGYDYVNTKFNGGTVTFTIKHKLDELSCSHCGSYGVVRQGTTTRQFRAVPIGRKAVFITLAIQRVFCPICGTQRQVELGFANPRHNYTKAFERYEVELSRFATIKDIAAHLSVS